MIMGLPLTPRAAPNRIARLFVLIAVLFFCPCALSAFPSSSAFGLVDEKDRYVSGAAPGSESPETSAPGKNDLPTTSEEGEIEAGSPGPQDRYGNVTEEEVEKTLAAEVRVADPLEKWNRFWFNVNDRLYFWLLRPAARGYKRAVPEDFRVLFNNFYKNAASPVRIVNSLLQLKLGYACDDFLRLIVNSTIGVGGLRDCAGQCFGIPAHDEDFGQTLGFYHVGPGFYIVWPIFGPSTVRDSMGMAGNYAADPMTWSLPLAVSFPLRAHERINYLTFHVGDYEALKRAAVDPYAAVRSAYIQNRAAAVAE